MIHIHQNDNNKETKELNSFASKQSIILLNNGENREDINHEKFSKYRSKGGR